MKKVYYVIDGQEHLTSYSAKLEASEQFKTEAAAIKRALELADSEPGKGFFVCQSLHVVAASVAPARVVSTGK